MSTIYRYALLVHLKASIILQSNLYYSISAVGQKRIRYPGDLEENDFASPKRAKQNFHFLMDTIEKNRRTNRRLTVEKKRLQNKVNTFQDMLEHLYKSKLLSEEMHDEMMVCYAYVK